MKRRYEKYRKYDVVYVDFGNNPHGVQSGIRPGVIVSCDRSNHEYAPQVCIVPLSTKLKDNPVHVKLNPEDVKGYKLKAKSDFIPEDMQAVSKGKIRGKTGYIPKNSPVRDDIDRSLILQRKRGKLIIKDLSVIQKVLRCIQWERQNFRN